MFSGAYNYSGGKACAPKAHPLGCDDPDSEVECTRGEHGNTMFLTIFAIQFAASIIIAAAILVLVHSVMIHERKMDRYSVNSSATRALTKQTTLQGFWYTVAFAVAWWPFILASIIKIFAGLQSIALYYISAVTFPLQGLFNAFLYFRPRYKAARERHGQDSRIKSICRILHVSMLPMVNSFKTDKTRKTDNDEMPINNDGDGEVGASDKNGNASFCENE